VRKSATIYRKTLLVKASWINYIEFTFACPIV